MRSYTILGLTGPTGSGKSTAARLFGEQGFVIIDADTLARNAVSKGSVCLRQLAYVFGEDIIGGDGELDRRLLASRAFSSAENTQMLNDITHPNIFLQAMRLCREYTDSGKNRIVFDAPLLLESCSDIMCDCVVSVIAPKAVRIERIAKRDGIDMQSIADRINAQHGDSYYISKSDFVIDGSQPIDTIRGEVERIAGAVTTGRCTGGG